MDGSIFLILKHSVVPKKIIQSSVIQE